MNMRVSYLPYSKTNSFSKLVVDFVGESENLKPFIDEFPSKEAILRQIERKKMQSIDRKLLQKVFHSQYGAADLHPGVKTHIEALAEENTFTICTAHQPNIFTGYLYFVYKIIHAIKLADVCSALFPAFKFVPVYYMGSEDNDIDEIGTFHYNNKTYTWNTQQTGACGRMHTKELMSIVRELKKTFNEDLPDEKLMINLLEEAYNGTNTLAEATRILVNSLFGKYGLLIINADDILLKEKFKPVMLNELFHQDSAEIVEETISRLSSQYKVQANPRAINLFYLKADLRERIEFKDNSWQVVNTDISFNEAEIEKEIELHPDRFSPNVILRPLYQESILPNIAFIGGGGELAYWLELKALFDAHKIVYPLLFLRNSVLWINEKTVAAMEKLSINIESAFLAKEELFKRLINEHETMKVLGKLTDELAVVYEAIVGLGNSVSPTLKQSMEAHTAKAKRVEERMSTKFRAQLKGKEEIILNKIEQIKEQIAPNGILQERHDNFLSIYKLLGLEMFDILYKHQQSFGIDFMILEIKDANQRLYI